MQRFALKVIFVALPIIALSAGSPNQAHAVTWGWESLSTGGIEYIVQVEPDLMDAFRQQGFSSDIPPGLRDVRRIRLAIGEGKLPNQEDVKGPEPLAAQKRSAALPEENKSPSTPDLLTFDRGQVPQSSAIGNGPTGSRLTSTTPTGENQPAAKPTTGFIPPKLFHPGWAKSINEAPGNSVKGNRSIDPTAVAASGANEATSRPSLPGGNPVQINRSTGQSFAVNHSPGELTQTSGNYPGQYAQDNWQPNHTLTDKPAAESSTPKPWWLLVFVMVLLFASIGANIYLVWIHQTVRSKYYSLVEKMPRQVPAV